MKIARILDFVTGASLVLLGIAISTQSSHGTYTAQGDRVVAVDRHGNQTTIYKADGKVVGVADVRGLLYVVARSAGAHDYVFKLSPGPAGGWGYTWLWRGCEDFNCDDGDNADQVFSTPGGSWGWRDRDGGWLGCGTVDVWSWTNRAPIVSTLKECRR